MLTSTMYEGNGSFASGATSSFTNTINNHNTHQEGSMEEDEASVMNHVAPPPYPPSNAASGTFPPPPVSIVETSTADWGMMVVDRNNINGQDSGSNNIIRVENEQEDDDYELVQGGVLILDGISSTGGDDNGEDPDASLSVPDSDNIPSDPGTIHGAAGGGGESGNHSREAGNWEHLISDDEEGDDEDNEEGHGNASRGRRRHGHITLKDIFPRICRFVRLTGYTIIAAFERRPTTAEDSSSTASTMEETSLPQFVRSTGFSLVMVALAVLLIPGYSYYQMAQSARNYEARWIQLQEENARLYQQEERLRKEMEALQEEAAAAMAKATSLYQEHEKWKILNAATSGPDDSDDKDFYFHDDCDKDSFTVLDNCWIKAKANVQLGDCGDGTKDFFKNLWSNFWSLPEYWGAETFGEYDFENYYAVEPYTSSSCSPNEEACQEREKGRDENDYYSDEDPLATVFSAVQSFGQSLSEKVSQLMHNEVANTRKAATEIEDAIQKRFTQASVAISHAMVATKNDVQALSLDVLTMLNTAAPMNKTSSSKTHDDRKAKEKEQPSSPDNDSRKGFFDAANALSFLSKTWNEALASMVTASTPVENEGN